MDWGGVEGSILSVDSSHESVDLLLQVDVFFDISSARNCNLNEDDLVPHFGMFLEESLQRPQSMGDSLDVIQAINSKKHLLASKLLLEVLIELLSLVCLELRMKFLRVNSHRADHGGHESSLVVQSGGRGLQSEEASARRQKVTAVITGVESQEVAVEEALQNRTPDGAALEDF